MSPEEDQETVVLANMDPVQESRTPPTRMDGRDFYPWSRQKIFAGEVLVISNIEDLPPEAARDRETWRSYGTKSTLVLPLSTGGKVFGALSFATTGQERDWPEVLVKRLELIAQLFANVLGRKRTEEALRESESRLGLTASAGEIGLWTVQLRTRRLWSSPMSLNLLGLSSDDQITEESFFDMVHTDDRKGLMRAMEAGVGKGAHVEYRVVRPDGSVRWLMSHARPSFDASGEPSA